jgi:hypothetical protein
MSHQKKQSTEAAVRETRQRSRRKFSPEEKIRIVLQRAAGEFRGSVSPCESVLQSVAFIPPAIHASWPDG